MRSQDASSGAWFRVPAEPTGASVRRVRADVPFGFSFLSAPGDIIERLTRSGQPRGTRPHAPPPPRGAEASDG